MPSEKDPDEVPVEVMSDAEPDGSRDGEDPSADELARMLESERQRADECGDRLRRALADFQNLDKKTRADIENGVNQRIDEFVLDFLAVYDDFARARAAFAGKGADTEGLDGILKNMDSLLGKYGVRPIDALGEIFDPRFHEAVSTVANPDLDDGTVTQEIRKGYISQERVIRPTLVEISKKG